MEIYLITFKNTQDAMKAEAEYKSENRYLQRLPNPSHDTWELRIKPQTD